MAVSGQASQAKRNRERASQERSAEKRVERARRKEEKKLRKAEYERSGEDPDLVGIVAGPQNPTRNDNG